MIREVLLEWDEHGSCKIMIIGTYKFSWQAAIRRSAETLSNVGIASLKCWPDEWIVSGIAGTTDDLDLVLEGLAGIAGAFDHRE